MAKHTARQALGHAVLGHYMLDASAATGGAQKFPEAASRRISFSTEVGNGSAKPRILGL